MAREYLSPEVRSGLGLTEPKPARIDRAAQLGTALVAALGGK
jgi:hypothetical protein